MTGVVVNGKTYITVADLIELAPTHPILDRSVLHLWSGRRTPVRAESEMLIARWTA